MHWTSVILAWRLFRHSHPSTHEDPRPRWICHTTSCHWRCSFSWMKGGEGTWEGPLDFFFPNQPSFSLYRWRNWGPDGVRLCPKSHNWFQASLDQSGCFCFNVVLASTPRWHLPSSFLTSRVAMMTMFERQLLQPFSQAGKVFSISVTPLPAVFLPVGPLSFCSLPISLLPKQVILSLSQPACCTPGWRCMIRNSHHAFRNIY